MRSLAELQELCQQNGIHFDASFGSRELMDALRDKLGVADPDLNLDPMKAVDLKDKIAWGSARPFEQIVKTYGNHNYRVEPKLDGARVRVIFGTTGNSIPTGRRSDVTFGYLDRGPNFPHVAQFVMPELAGTVLDCEVLMPQGTSIDLGGKKGFTKGPLNTIMAVLNINSAEGIARQKKYGYAEFHCFDILAYAGESVMHYRADDRRRLLENVLYTMSRKYESSDQFAPWWPFPFKLIEQQGVSEESLQGLLDVGYEGGMIKEMRAPYEPGKRSASWAKVKRMSTGDFFIIGSTPGKGRNEGLVGSLKLAYMGDDGKPVYCADMRGFDDATCNMITDPETGEVRSTFIGRVVELMGQGRTKNDRIRHPHFVRWREDKTYLDCTRDQLLLFSEV